MIPNIPLWLKKARLAWSFLLIAPLLAGCGGMPYPPPMGYGPPPYGPMAYRTAVGPYNGMRPYYGAAPTRPTVVGMAAPGAQSGFSAIGSNMLAGAGGFMVGRTLKMSGGAAAGSEETEAGAAGGAMMAKTMSGGAAAEEDGAAATTAGDGAASAEGATAGDGAATTAAAGEGAGAAAAGTGEAAAGAEALGAGGAEAAGDVLGAGVAIGAGEVLVGAAVIAGAAYLTYEALQHYHHAESQ